MRKHHKQNIHRFTDEIYFSGLTNDVRRNLNILIPILYETDTVTADYINHLDYFKKIKSISATIIVIIFSYYSFFCFIIPVLYNFKVIDYHPFLKEIGFNLSSFFIELKWYNFLFFNTLAFISYFFLKGFVYKHFGMHLNYDLERYFGCHISYIYDRFVDKEKLKIIPFYYSFASDDNYVNNKLRAYRVIYDLFYRSSLITEESNEVKSIKVYSPSLYGSDNILTNLVDEIFISKRNCDIKRNVILFFYIALLIYYSIFTIIIPLLSILKLIDNDTLNTLSNSYFEYGFNLSLAFIMNVKWYFAIIFHYFVIGFSYALFNKVSGRYIKMYRNFEQGNAIKSYLENLQEEDFFNILNSSDKVKIVNIDQIVDESKRVKDEISKVNFDEGSGSKKPKPTVFISYAKEDENEAVILYQRLVEAGCNPWIDKKLVPGQDWKFEIKKNINNSDYVILCLSTNSVNKRGYVQKELKMSIDLYDEFPEGSIFLIPVRLNDCEIPSKISHLHYVDLFSNEGFDKLTDAIFREGDDHLKK